jgi:hypothetical protein
MEFEVKAEERVSMAIIRAVSTAEGTDPCSLPPLVETLDPDALDMLFATGHDGSPRTGGRISFVYAEYRVTVDNNEFLTIEPLETTGRLSAQSEGTGQTERSRSNRDTQQTATMKRGSRNCIVCQQPIEQEDLQRERAELIHQRCHAELRCGISLERWSEQDL